MRIDVYCLWAIDLGCSGEGKGVPSGGNCCHNRREGTSTERRARLQVFFFFCEWCKSASHCLHDDLHELQANYLGFTKILTWQRCNSSCDLRRFAGNIAKRLSAASAWARDDHLRQVEISRDRNYTCVACWHSVYRLGRRRQSYYFFHKPQKSLFEGFHSEYWCHYFTTEDCLPHSSCLARQSPLSNRLQSWQVR